MDETTKLSKAIDCLKKKFQCILCNKPSTDIQYSKCGHSFCGNCMETELRLRRCSVCKSSISQSSVYKLENIDKIAANFKGLTDAIEKDLGTNVTFFNHDDSSLERPKSVKQYKNRRKNLEPSDSIAGSSKSKIVKDDSVLEKSKKYCHTNAKLYRPSNAKSYPVERRSSIDSEETVKINKSEPQDRHDKQENVSQVTDTSIIEPNDKVQRWMDSEEFGNQNTIENDFIENVEQLDNENTSNSTTTSNVENMKPNSRVTTPAEKMFNEMILKQEKQTEPKKVKVSSTPIKKSWGELEQFKKETHPKRKRKRLNVSIEKPESVKQVVVESFGTQNYEEQKDSINSSTENKPNENTPVRAEPESNKDSDKKRKKPNILSSRTLDPNETMHYIKNLNKRQISKIIGIDNSETDLDKSRNSNDSPDKTLVKSTEDKLSLTVRKSNVCSQNNSNEAISLADTKKEKKQQSEESCDSSDNRPDSILLSKNLNKPTPNKFRLSITKTSATPNNDCLDTSQKQDATLSKEEQSKKIILSQDSPIKPCSDYIKNKLSLKQPSEIDCKINASFKKLGKLYKPHKNVKFISLGSTKSELSSKKFQDTSLPVPISTSNIDTQTFPGLFFSDESLFSMIGPGKCLTSSALDGLKKTIEEYIANANTKSEPVQLSESENENQVVNEAKIHFQDKDSQLRYSMLFSPVQIFNPDLNNSIDLMPAISKEKMIEVKNYATKLLCTDSEDQDTSSEKFSRSKRKDRCKKSTSTSKKRLSGATISSVSKLQDENELTTSFDSTIINKFPLVNLEGKSSRNSAKKKKKELSSDLSGSSAATIRSVKKQKSQSNINKKYYEYNSESDADNALSEEISKDASHHLGDSGSPNINVKHKVVRKLKYSQESGSSSDQHGVSEQHKSLSCSLQKKNFQRIRQIVNSDSEDESLEISLTPKPSTSKDLQNITGPGISQGTLKSLMPSEDLTVVFCSNKETPESKRKRSPSPNVLDINDIRAIAANWFAELDNSREETNDISGTDLRPIDNQPVKKKKVECQNSTSSLSTESLPTSNPTNANCDNKKNNVTKRHSNMKNVENLDSCNVIEKVDEKKKKSFDNTDRKSTSSAKSTYFLDQIQEPMLINSDGIEPMTPEKVNQRSSSRSNSTIKDDEMNQEISPSKTLTPIRVKSFASIHSFNKENEVEKTTINETEHLTNVQKNIPVNKDSNKSLDRKNSKTSMAENISTSNDEKPPHNKTNNDQFFDSPFDFDLNITEEQAYLQEFENNLLGRKSISNLKKSSQAEKAETCKSETLKKISCVKEPSKTSSDEKVTGRVTPQIDSDDSMMIEEDIIEKTPEKNVSLKKDLLARIDNSQRSTASWQSFMLNSKPAGHQYSLSKNSAIRPSYHSTPKSTSTVQESNKLTQSSKIITLENARCKLCFVCSCLPASDIVIVKSFARKTNAEYTTDYKPEVTHIIVEKNQDNSASRTLKYLFGVAHKKWIVNFQWAIDSMNQGKLLKEDDYEVVDGESNEPGPRRSRLSKEGLFKDFAFVCVEPFSQIKISELEDLLSSIGGKIFKSLKDLSVVTNKYKIILYDSKIIKTTTLENYRQSLQALPVSIDWIFTCISQYELVSFYSYVQQKDFNLAIDLGFPAEFLTQEEEEEEEESFGENETSLLNDA